MVQRLSTESPLNVPRWDDPQEEKRLGLPGLGLPRIEPPGLGQQQGVGIDQLLASGSIKGAKGMNPQFAAAIAGANAAMQRAGLGAFSITSGFRSNAQQQALYDKWIASGKTSAPSVATPGNSRHESGTAVDINWSQLNTAQRKFLNQYLPSVGVHPVGLGFDEPWHWEYGNR